jgi:hypothetical protein
MTAFTLRAFSNAFIGLPNTHPPIHIFPEVNQARVWQTIVTDLPPLRATVQQLLQS